jgi:hypothetical protein
MNIEELTNYNELSGLIDPKHLPHPEMSKCFVMRASDNSIKGYIFIQTIFTVEPIWVADEVKGSLTAVRLFEAACQFLKSKNQTQVFTHSSSPEISNYLTRLGLKPTGYEAFTGEL